MADLERPGKRRRSQEKPPEALCASSFGRIEELRAAERGAREPGWDLGIAALSQHGGFCRAESGDEVPHAAKVGITAVPVCPSPGSVLEVPTELFGVHFVLWKLAEPVGSPCMQPVTEMPACTSPGGSGLFHLEILHNFCPL